jgi:hypothetical protein
MHRVPELRGKKQRVVAVLAVDETRCLVGDLQARSAIGTREADRARLRWRRRDDRLEELLEVWILRTKPGGRGEARCRGWASAAWGWPLRAEGAKVETERAPARHAARVLRDEASIDRELARHRSGKCERNRARAGNGRMKAEEEPRPEMSRDSDRALARLASELGTKPWDHHGAPALRTVRPGIDRSGDHARPAAVREPRHGRNYTRVAPVGRGRGSRCKDRASAAFLLHWRPRW